MFHLIRHAGFGIVSARRGFATSSAGPTSWDAPSKSSTITLSNSNRTAYAGNAGPADAAVRGNAARSAGRAYFEVAYDNTAGAARVGVMPLSAFSDAVNVGAAGAGVSFDLQNGQIRVDGALIATAAGLTVGQVARFAIDLTFGAFWAGAVGAAWNGHPDADPFDERRGVPIPALAGVSCCIVASFVDQDDVGDLQVTLNSGHAAYSGGLPGGAGTDWQSF